MLCQKYIMPLIVLVGLVGNSINLAVLSSGHLRSGSSRHRGQRLSKRSAAMYTYMKALAVTDILYLILTIEGCIFTTLVSNSCV